MDRQKAFMIFGAALLVALGLTWFLHSRIRGVQTEQKVRVVAATRDLPPGTRIRKTDLRLASVSQPNVPKGAILDTRSALDRAVLYPVGANELLTSARLTSLTGADGISATIEPGKRAIAVPITDASGVAGLIQPRSRVDVLFTRAGSVAEASTITILQDIEVLAIGRTTQALQTTTVDPRAPRAATATLLVTPEEARKLELAKNQGKLSLALRNPLDRGKAPDSPPVTFDALDPGIYARTARARRGLPPNVGAGRASDVQDDAAWRELIGERKREEKKEPPKPRAIVDVFRGDKHVQEIFP
ncbi:MAG: Flp pilus assembly protein CpaB [Acidobacteriota bacterium]